MRLKRDAVDRIKIEKFQFKIVAELPTNGVSFIRCVDEGEEFHSFAKTKTNAPLQRRIHEQI